MTGAAARVSRSARLDRTLAALAEPSRRRVVELLRDRPRSAGELSTGVGLTPAALTRHLKTLVAAGLIDASHPASDARVRIYRLNPKPMGDLMDWLARTEALRAGQLASLKAHVEERR